MNLPMTSLYASTWERGYDIYCGKGETDRIDTIIMSYYGHLFTQVPNLLKMYIEVSLYNMKVFSNVLNT